MTKPLAKTPVAEMKIGPFSSGMNTYSDPASIADSEMVDCVNFDIDLDGSLKSRPPWSSQNGGYTNSEDVLFSGTLSEYNTQVLGSFVFYGNKLVVHYFRQLYNSGGVVDEQILSYYWVDGPRAGTRVNITVDASGIFNPFTDVIRYKDVLYFFRANGGGGSWTFPATDTGTGTYAAIAFPPAAAAAVYKERVWLVNGATGTNKSRLYFSDVATPQTFQPASFFDVRPGDGETLNDLLVYQDNLYLFKNNSMWVFAYDTQVTQAVIQQLHEDLGVDNAWSVCLYENVIYFQKFNQVYQISNFDVTRISTKIPFVDDRTIPLHADYPTEDWSTANDWLYPVSLSLVGDRLVVRFYNRLYVYHLRIRAWTRWTSQALPIKYMGQIIRVETAGATNKTAYEQYVSGTALKKAPVAGINSGYTIRNIMIMSDTYNSTYTEGITFDAQPYTPTDIVMNLSTKIYDVGLSAKFKRLMHWGVDVVTGRPVRGTISPFSVAYRVTWNQLVAYRWNQLQTWGYPLFAQPDITQDVAVDGGIYKRFVRFPKSLRFRLIQFNLELKTVGNTTDGPTRLYSLTAYIAQKQLVPRGVN